MDVGPAAGRWAETWEHAWPARYVDAIASLYAEGDYWNQVERRERPYQGWRD